jgi:hypothetical protein
MALRVAATLRIADHIADGVRTAPELAELVHVDADALERLMRYLAARPCVRMGNPAPRRARTRHRRRDPHPHRRRRTTLAS